MIAITTMHGLFVSPSLIAQPTRLQCAAHAHDD